MRISAKQIRVQHERYAQQGYIKWLNRQYPGALTIAGLGDIAGKAAAGVADKTRIISIIVRIMFALGYRKGTLDLYIVEPKGVHSGLAIDFKTVKGRATKEQLAMVTQLQARGWVARIGTLDQAMEWTRQYLALKPGERMG